VKARWSKWQPFNEKRLVLIPRKPGIYQFRCISSKGFPLNIPRLKRTDPAGVIYIGESDDLKKRVSNFWITIRERGKSRHAAGWTYCSFNYFPLFPPKNLQFRYKVMQNTIAGEFDLLLSYRKKFMDLPPLNSTRSQYPRNWRKKMKEAFGVNPLK
jgi:hypothetical protein